MLRKIFYRSLIKKCLLIILFTSFPLIPSALYSQEEDYVANYGRIRYLENTVNIIRGVDGLAEESTINAPIFPGDTVSTSRDAKAEFQLADSSIIRLNYATKLKFQALSDLYNTYEQSTVLKLYNGSIYIEAENMDDKEKNFQIDTPFASIYVLTDGLYRINVDSEQKVEIFCYRGVAEVVGEYDSVLLRSGKMTFVTYRSSPADPRGFNSFYSDSFDIWNDERDEFYYQTGEIDEYYDDVPYEIKRYYIELSYYGNWVNVPVYGYVWYPYHIYAGWRPYYNGYWCYGPNSYFWVSYEPWGWAPYHYGRWSWVSGYGWIWIPGRVFCGAWVSWCYGSDYLGWCALDYWNRPAFINVNLYLDLYDFRTWNFVYYRDVASRNVRHAVLRGGIVEKELRDAIVARKSPRFSPSLLSRNAEARHKTLREVRTDEKTRMKKKHMERTPIKDASFRDLEKKKIKHEPLVSKAPSKDRRKASDIKGRKSKFDLKKDTKGEKEIPKIRKRSSQYREPVGDKESKRIPSRDKNLKDTKTYSSNIKERDTRVTKEFKSRPSYERRESVREPKIKSYSRRMTEGKVQKNKSSAYPLKRIKESQRNTEQRGYQKKYYKSQDRRIHKSKPSYNSSQKWKKMLKDMSQPRKTHQIKKQAPQRKQVISKGTSKSKSGSKSSSSKQSKSSSGKSKSSSRGSKRR